MPNLPAYEVEKRRAKVARYVARGLTYAEIANLVGVSSSQVSKDYRKWREQRVARLRTNHDEAFIEVLNGYDEAIRRAWEELSAKRGKDGGPQRDKADSSEVAALINQIGRLLEKKARLTGLVSGQDGGPTTNILAIVSPDAADQIKHLMTPEKAADIEDMVLEGEWREVTEPSADQLQLPLHEDADSD